jgi:hypothetical protein
MNTSYILLETTADVKLLQKITDVLDVMSRHLMHVKTLVSRRK